MNEFLKDTGGSRVYCKNENFIQFRGLFIPFRQCIVWWDSAQKHIRVVSLDKWSGRNDVF